ncbi:MULTISPECIES: hypothetical protein [Prochlorococcus]|uniref:hypothetical protein n=1 Tax=Prochlorococcus TaxID=1218 RepID=UPI00053393F9|nr:MULTISPECIES: hypothetical protein [Prochlorococcus]KGG12650.1 hypothetical protein EV05_1863 [Prochlorococcus sp. MIT 0601]
MDNKLKKEDRKSSVDMKPVSNSLMRIYAFFAILLVLIPEWLAEITIELENKHSHKKLPKTGFAWNVEPELKVSTLRFSELRLLAKELKIEEYARQSKNLLAKKILQKLKKEISTKGSRRYFFD